MIATVQANPRPSLRPRLTARYPFLIPALVLFLGVVTTASHAGRVRSLDIQTMTDRAGTIFSGRCTSVATVDHPPLGQPVTELTFAVLRSVKGVPDSDGRRQISVRMLPAGSLAGFPEGPGGGIRPGDEVVLFLYPESVLGLTSPVGLGQGRFAVFPDAKGNQDGGIAVNAWGNRKLLDGVGPGLLEQLTPEERVQLQTGRVLPATLLDVAERLTRPVRPRVTGSSR